MTKREATNIVLLAIVPALEEFHVIFKKSNAIVNWFLLIDYPLGIQWYFRFLGGELARFFLASVIYRLSRLNYTMRIASLVWMIMTLVDILLFFLCFNMDYYTLVYSLIGVIAGSVFYVRALKTDKSRRSDVNFFGRSSRKRTEQASQN